MSDIKDQPGTPLPQFNGRVAVVDSLTLANYVRQHIDERAKIASADAALLALVDEVIAEAGRLMQ